MTAPVWSFRRPALLGLGSIAVLILGFGLWAVLTEIAGAVVAPGRVEVEQNRQIVQHPDGGVVAEIRVTEGARVAAGDVLLRLDGALLQSEQAIVDGQLTEIRARRARLEAERDDSPAPQWPDSLTTVSDPAKAARIAEQIDGQQRLFDARRLSARQEAEQLARQIEQIRARILGIDAQDTALQLQLDLIAEELASQQTLLDKGLTQSASVLALRREEARLLGQIGELASTRAQSDERITEIEVQRSRLSLNRREEASRELRDIGPTELELAERSRALEERISRLEIRAPVAGIVLGLEVTTPRAVIRPADPLLYLVPQDRPLVITAEVSPLQIDNVQPGQAAELVFPAFSARTTPHLTGKVTLVSADALSNPQTQTSYYRVEITLDPGQIDRLGGQPLLPGMPVEAFLQTGARSPLAYLVQPFTDYFTHAFRES